MSSPAAEAVDAGSRRRSSSGLGRLRRRDGAIGRTTRAGPSPADSRDAAASRRTGSRAQGSGVHDASARRREARTGNRRRSAASGTAMAPARPGPGPVQGGQQLRFGGQTPRRAGAHVRVERHGATVRGSSGQGNRARSAVLASRRAVGGPGGQNRGPWPQARAANSRLVTDFTGKSGAHCRRRQQALDRLGDRAGDRHARRAAGAHLSGPLRGTRPGALRRAARSRRWCCRATCRRTTTSTRCSRRSIRNSAASTSSSTARRSRRTKSCPTPFVNTIPRGLPPRAGHLGATR